MSCEQKTTNISEITADNDNNELPIIKTFAL